MPWAVLTTQVLEVTAGVRAGHEAAHVLAVAVGLAGRPDRRTQICAALWSGPWLPAAWLVWQPVVPVPQVRAAAGIVLSRSWHAPLTPKVSVPASVQPTLTLLCSARTSSVAWHPAPVQVLAPVDAVCSAPVYVVCLPLPLVTWHWSQVWALQLLVLIVVTELASA